MKRVIAYLLFLLAVYSLLIVVVLNQMLPAWLVPHQQVVLCGIIAGVAGVLYCLRGVYISKCVRQVWDDLWLPWYFIRPIVSPFCGLVAYFFLKAGLLVLDAGQSPDHQYFGFYAIAFVAGYNVDKFLVKIEQLAEAAWGIDRSPTAVRDARNLAGDANKDRPAKDARG
jgi:hypothetical protein